MTNMQEEIKQALEETFAEDVKEVEFLNDNTLKVSFASNVVAKNPVLVMNKFDEAVKPLELKEFAVKEINELGALIEFAFEEETGEPTEEASAENTPAEEAPATEEVEGEDADQTIKIEVKDDKIEVEANINNVEFEGEIPAEDTLEEKPAEAQSEDEVTPDESAEEPKAAEESVSGCECGNCPECKKKEKDMILKFWKDAGESCNESVKANEAVSIDKEIVKKIQENGTTTEKQFLGLLFAVEKDLKDIVYKEDRIVEFSIANEYGVTKFLYDAEADKLDLKTTTDPEAPAEMEVSNEEVDPISLEIKKIFVEEGLMKDEDFSESLKEKLNSLYAKKSQLEAPVLEVSVPTIEIPVPEKAEGTAANEEVEDSAYVKILAQFKEAGILKDDAKVPEELKAKIDEILMKEEDVLPKEDQQGVVGDPVKEVEAIPTPTPEEVVDLQEKLIKEGKTGMLDEKKVIFVEANESIFFFDGEKTQFGKVKPSEEIDCNESCEFFNYIVKFADKIGEIASPFLKVTPFAEDENKYSIKTAYEMDPGVIAQLLKVLTPVKFKLLPVA